jgi:hypothetical protein
MTPDRSKLFRCRGPQRCRPCVYLATQLVLDALNMALLPLRREQRQRGRIR